MSNANNDRKVTGLWERLQGIERLNDIKDKRLRELQSESSQLEGKYKDALNAQRREFESKLAVMRSRERTHIANISELESEILFLRNQNQSLNGSLRQKKDHFAFYFILMLCILVIFMPMFQSNPSEDNIMTEAQSMEEYNLIKKDKYDEVEQQNEELQTSLNALQHRFTNRLAMEDDKESKLRMVEEQLHFVQNENDRLVQNHISPRQFNQESDRLRDIIAERDEMINDLNSTLIACNDLVYDTLLKQELETVKFEESQRSKDEIINDLNDTLRACEEQEFKKVVDNEKTVESAISKDEILNEDKNVRAAEEVLPCAPSVSSSERYCYGLGVLLLALSMALSIISVVCMFYNTIRSIFNNIIIIPLLLSENIKNISSNMGVTVNSIKFLATRSFTTMRSGSSNFFGRVIKLMRAIFSMIKINLFGVFRGIEKLATKSFKFLNAGRCCELVLWLPMCICRCPAFVVLWSCLKLKNAMIWLKNVNNATWRCIIRNCYWALSNMGVMVNAIKFFATNSFTRTFSMIKINLSKMMRSINKLATKSFKFLNPGRCCELVLWLPMWICRFPAFVIVWSCFKLKKAMIWLRNVSNATWRCIIQNCYWATSKMKSSLVWCKEIICECPYFMITYENTMEWIKNLKFAPRKFKRWWYSIETNENKKWRRGPNGRLLSNFNQTVSIVTHTDSDSDSD